MIYEATSLEFWLFESAMIMRPAHVML